jgi:hypothetical protein
MRKILPILFVLSLALSPCAAAASSVSATLCMPAEYVNYTIASVNGTLWVEVEGTYPISFSDAGSSGVSPGALLMVYPVPPETANVQITLNGTELDWDDYTQFYPAALHHTAVGNWRMINCTVSNVSSHFVLKIRYEHPLATVNGSYMFLYDLNIEPYLSPQNPNSTAYFNILTDVNILDLKAYTTETDTVWDPINYTTSYEGTTQVFSVQIQSEYSKPLAGDLVVTFDGEGTLQSPSLTVLALLAVTISVAGAGLFAYSKKRRGEAAQA